MLDTSVLGELTADVCAAITARPDAAALLQSTDAANLFLVALDDERTSFRYHHLVRRMLRAELRARDRDREQALQLRAAEWYERRIARPRPAAAWHLLAARQADRALHCRPESCPASSKTTRRSRPPWISARSTLRC